MYFVHTTQIKELKLSLLKVTLEIEAEWNLALTWAGDPYMHWEIEDWNSTASLGIWLYSALLFLLHLHLSPRHILARIRKPKNFHLSGNYVLP